MRLCLLFSGGKDSCYAGWLAWDQIVCLASVLSTCPYSFMYHTPNIELVKLQARAIGKPIVSVRSFGKKEAEISDLRRLLERAISNYKIEGVVTGAIDSIYQASRIQRVCARLGLWCFNPIWQVDQLAHLRAVLQARFKVLITGVFGYPLDESWLGRKLDKSMIDKLAKLKEKFRLNPAGEGGEIETFVYDGPIFKRKIKILKTRKEYRDHTGRLIIERAKC